MKITVTPTFKKAFKRLNKKSNSLGVHIRSLHSQLLENPKQGMSLGNGFYKIRIASDYSGKSGGYRVVTYYCNADTVCLVHLYQKSELENIPLSVLKKILSE